MPHESTIATDDFLALTLDVWSMPTESARRVGHPAPFPVELPAQLIRLYTYRDDVVLDPFMGSGSTMVAAAQLGRPYVGYDLDPAYVALAEQRVAAAGAVPCPDDDGQAMAKTAERMIEDAGFRIVGNSTVPRCAAAGRSWVHRPTDRSAAHTTMVHQ